MAPFVEPCDVPPYTPLTEAELYGEVPALPAELAEADALESEWYAAGGWSPSLEPPCRCGCCADPADSPSPSLEGHELRAERFEAAFRASQAQLAAAWRAAAGWHAAVLAERGPLAAEHVGAELAVRMGVHPRTGTQLMITAVRAVSEIPRLVELVESGLISDRHVQALLGEVSVWTDDDAQARLVLERTLDVCADRATRCGWPTPGEMKRTVQRVAILLDLQAAEKKRATVAERRGVSLLQTGAGGAALTIEGPDLQLALAYRAIQERAAAMAELEGDTRSRHAREYDAAIELLTIDADMGPVGAVSARPTTGLQGEPLELVVRGAHVAVVVPYSVALGGGHELAEIPGFGPILPSAARELLEHADSVRRVAVAAASGEVLAVDDAIAGPNRRRQRQARKQSLRPTEPVPRDRWPDGHEASGSCTEPDSTPSSKLDDPGARSAPSTPITMRALRAALEALSEPELAPGGDQEVCHRVLSADTLALLHELALRKVIWRDLNTSAYRVPGRLRRFLEYRDRTCCFPGCTVPGRYCDVDHREEWPRGGTHEDNCHVLCRRHHRAKQFYFADVTLDPVTGDTCWTTHEGLTYRRPPPRF